MLMENSNQF